MKHTDIKTGDTIILKPYRAKAYGLTNAQYKVFKIYTKESRKTPWIICEVSSESEDLLYFKPSDILTKGV